MKGRAAPNLKPAFLEGGFLAPGPAAAFRLHG